MDSPSVLQVWMVITKAVIASLKASDSPHATPLSIRDQRIRELGSLVEGTKAGSVQRPEVKSR